MIRSTLMHRLGPAVAGIVLCVGSGDAPAEVVAVVSARSTVATLSKNQITDIFLGKASRFPDGTTAVPINLAEGSSTRDEFYARFAGKSPAQLTAYWSKIIFTGRGHPPREVATGAELKKRLAATPGGIGYLEQDQVDASVQVVPLQ